MVEERAIGRVLVDKVEMGTAWAISPCHIVTCLHCLQDRRGEVTTESIAFKLPEHESAAALEERDEDSDVAVLRLESEIPAGWSPLAAAILTERLEGVKFLSEGFPALRDWPETSVPIHGRLVSTSNFDRKAAAYVLYAAEVAAARDPHGFSGAPVLVDLDVADGSEIERRKVAVGVIRYSPPRPDGAGVGYGGAIYASHLDAIAGKHEEVAERLLPATVAATSPRGVDRTRSRRGHRIDFDEHLRSAEAFIGREALLDQIESETADRDRGYIHLQASAGLGKTALAANFAVRKEAPAFFADASLGLVRADQCLKHLSAEMIERFGLSDQRLAEQSGSDLTTFAAILADAAARQDGPLWLIVDGLDEAASPLPGGNPLSLPRQLPANAFVLTTSRESAAELNVDPSTPMMPLRLSAEGADQRRDLERFVLHRLQTDTTLGTAVAASGLSVAQLAEQVAEAADGNFLYVTYVLADVGDGEIDIEAAPEQLTGYYEQRFWSVMEPMMAGSDEKWRTLFKPVITSLAVAAEPVDVVWLEQQVGRVAEDIEREVLRPLRRFLRTAEIEGKQGWLIVHRSFADFLGTKFDLGAAHRAVAATLRSHPGPYASRHLTEHLRAGGEIDALIDLARSPAWEESQLLADPTGGRFINDIRQVWSAVERSPDSRLGRLDIEVWCLLAIASVRSTMQLIPPALLAGLVAEETWTFERARDTALQNPDPFNRARALLALAPWEPTLLDDAVAAAEEVHSLTRRAEALREIAESIEDEARRLEILAPFIELPAMVDDHNGPHAIAALVPVLPEALLPRAFEVAREAAHAIERTVLFLALTERADGVVADPVALESFDDVGLPPRLNAALKPPLKTVAAAEAAAALLHEIEASEWPNWAGSQRNDGWVMCALAPRLDRDGLQHALSYAEALGGGTFDEATALAMALADRGDAAAALRSLVDNPPSRADAFPAVISRLPSNSIDAALAMIREIPEPFSRGEAVGALVGRLPQARRQSEIDAALPQGQLGDGSYFASALREMAAYVTAADVGRALATLGAARSSTDVAYALVALAPHLSDVTHVDHAMGRADIIAYKADDIARAAVIRRVRQSELLRTAFTSMDSDFGAGTAVAIAESLGEDDRAALFELMSAGLQAGIGTAVLAFSALLSDEEIETLVPLLEQRDRERLAVLRSIFPGRPGGPSAAAIAADAATLHIAEDFLVQNAIALLAAGRGDEAIALAKASERTGVTVCLAEESAMLDGEQRQALIELLLGARDWEQCVRGLIDLADDLDPESLRQVLAALRVRDEEVDRTISPEYRQVAQLQRDTSLLPLVAGLSPNEREPLLADLRAQAAAAGIGDVIAALRIIPARTDRLPPDIAELLYTMVNRVLHDLEADPRDEVLAVLGDLIHAVSAVGGPDLAAQVTGRVLDARDRWP